MSQPVKKPYNSALRAAQARATRRAIVDAAARLFTERGYTATTMEAIAEAAGGVEDGAPGAGPAPGLAIPRWPVDGGFHKILQ